MMRWSIGIATVVSSLTIPFSFAADEGLQLYEKHIAGVLAERCVECHGEGKRKGKLRLDTAKGMAQGGSTGPGIVAGHPEQSEVYARIILPAGDDDVMPPKGGTLTKEQIAAFKRWIELGASLPDGDLVEKVSRHEDGRALAMDELAQAMSKKFQPPSANVLNKLRDRGWIIRNISKDGLLVDVMGQQAKPAITDEDVKDLMQIAPHIAWLNLSQSKVTDSGCALLKQCTNLQRLRLDGCTAISDAGLQGLGECKKLESLNLVGTQIGDAALSSLLNSPSLKKVFAWKTNVTESAKRSAEEKKKDLKVDLGTLPAMPEPEPQTPANRRR